MSARRSDESPASGGLFEQLVSAVNRLVLAVDAANGKLEAIRRSLFRVAEVREYVPARKRRANDSVPCGEADGEGHGGVSPDGEGGAA